MTNSIQFVEANKAFIQGAAAAIAANERQELAFFSNLLCLMGKAWAQHSAVRPGSNKTSLTIKLEDIAIAAYSALPQELKTPEVPRDGKREANQFYGVTFSTVKQYLSTASTMVATHGKRYNEKLSLAARAGNVPDTMKALDAMGLRSIRGARALGAKPKGTKDKPTADIIIVRKIKALADVQGVSKEALLLKLAKTLECEASLRALIVKQAQRATRRA